MKHFASLSSAFYVTAILATFSGASPAKADANAAFCLQNYGTFGSECNYYSLAQCKSASSGAGGSCIANPLSALAFDRKRAGR